MSRLAKEIALFLLCLAVAFAVNAWSIAAFHTQWSELYTTLPITLAIALILYVALTIVRLLIFILRRLLTRRMA
jgi:TRAP-type C4-dicarboxylate transport system permease small subunit